MEKMMKALKASSGVVSLHSRSMSMFKEATFYVEQYMYKNLYESEKKKTDELKRVLELGILITKENQCFLDKVNRSLNTIINIKKVRPWIKEIEDSVSNVPEEEMAELNKDIDKLPRDIQLKEFTKRKWTYMLKKSGKSGALRKIARSLASSDDPRIEAFCSNVAEVKSLVCEDLRPVKFTSAHFLPKEYCLLEDNRFKDTMRILLESRSGS